MHKTQRIRIAIADIKRFLPRFQEQAEELCRLGVSAEAAFRTQGHHVKYRELQDRAGEFEAFAHVISTRLEDAKLSEPIVEIWLGQYHEVKMDCLRVYIRTYSQFISMVNKKVLETREFPLGFLDQLRKAMVTLDSLVWDCTNDAYYQSRASKHDVEVMLEMRRYIEECRYAYRDVPDFGVLPERPQAERPTVSRPKVGR